MPAGAVHAFRNVGTSPARIHFELILAGESEEAFARLIAEADAIEDVAAFFDCYDMDLILPSDESLGCYRSPVGTNVTHRWHLPR